MSAKIRSPRKNSGPLTRNDMVNSERPVRPPEYVELNTLEDYRNYNIEARANGWRLRYPPEEVHERKRVIINRLDGQGENPIKVKLTTLAHGMEIDYENTLVPGKEIELPTPVIKHLLSKVYPQYKVLKHPDGTSETVFSHNLNRFSISSADL